MKQKYNLNYFTLLVTSLLLMWGIFPVSADRIYNCSGDVVSSSPHISGDKGIWEVKSSKLYIDLTNGGDNNIISIPDYQEITSPKPMPQMYNTAPWNNYAPCIKEIVLNNMYDKFSIGDRAFYGFSSLTGMYGPDDTDSIYKSRINIPSNIVRIGAYAFTFCTDAKFYADFSNRPTPPELGWDAFFGTRLDRSILIIPAGSRKAYESTQWGEFGYITVMGPGSINDIADTLWLYEEDVYVLKNLVDEDVTDKTFKWYVDNKESVVITGEERWLLGCDECPYTSFEEGVVYAKFAGITNVKLVLYSNNVSTNFTIVVKKKLAKQVNINESEIRLHDGETYKLINDINISGYPDTVIYTKKVKWHSNKTYVATVDDNGVVTKTGSGKCTITATGDKGIKDICTVICIPPVEGVRLDRHKLYMYIDSTQQLTAFPIPELSETDIEWSSNNPNIASVDSNGVVTANAVGEAIITAKTLQGDFVDTCNVTVRLDGGDYGLKYLTVDGLEITPEFNTHVLEYSGTTTRYTDTGINIYAEVNQPIYSVKGIGQKILPHGNDTTFFVNIVDSDNIIVNQYSINIHIDELQGTNGGMIWILDADSTLNIYGEGKMDDLEPDNIPTWYNYISTIKSIVVHEGITYIGKYAFDSCINVTSVRIPKSMESIGGYAFYNCESLFSIDLVKITEIGDMVFAHCNNLNSVIIPETLTEFGYDVFHDYGKILSVTNKSHIPQEIDEKVFINKNGESSTYDDTLYVYAASIETYKNTEVWKDFGKITTIEPHDATLKNIDIIVGGTPYSLPVDVDSNEIKIMDGISNIEIIAEPNDLNSVVIGIGKHNVKHDVDTTFTIKVTAVNGIDVKEYKVKVKHLGKDATLKDLLIKTNTGIVDITPAFNSNTFEYKVEIPVSVSEITIIATPYDSCSVVENGGGKNLNTRFSIYRIKVTSENKKIKNSYNLTVTKPEGVINGISVPSNELTKVYVSEGILHIESPVSERVDIYSVTGNLMYSMEKPAGKITFASNSSGRILIVKGSSGWVKKIID